MICVQNVHNNSVCFFFVYFVQLYREPMMIKYEYFKSDIALIKVNLQIRLLNKFVGMEIG